MVVVVEEVAMEATVKRGTEAKMPVVTTVEQMVDRVDKRIHRLNPDQVLLLWGAKDFVFDTCFLDEFLKRLPGARFHVFEDAGHYLFEDKPEETVEQIHRFLIS